MKQCILAVAFALTAIAVVADEPQKTEEKPQPAPATTTLKAAEPLTTNPGSTPAPQYINSKPKSVLEGGEQATAPSVSPFVAAARRSNRGAKKPAIVITNEMLAKDGGHFTSNEAAHDATAAGDAATAKKDEHTSPEAQKVLDEERKRITKSGDAAEHHPAPTDSSANANAPKQDDAKH